MGVRRILVGCLAAIISLVLVPLGWLYKRALAWPNRSILKYVRPTPWMVTIITAPVRFFSEPVTTGLENVPTDRPVLFVGNHTLYALDMALLQYELYYKRGIYYRGLADRFHMYIPVWKHLLEYVGAVEGTPDNCSLLMRQRKDCILVYPGGAHEVLKNKGDPKYALMWQDRTGFARLAIQHGFTIVPFSSCGMEDMFEIWFDVPCDWLMWLLGDKRRNISFPVAKFWKFRPQRCYLHFGKPISTAELKGRYDIQRNVHSIRDKSYAAVLEGINMLRTRQAKDTLRRFSCSRKMYYLVVYLLSLLLRLVAWLSFGRINFGPKPGSEPPVSLSPSGGAGSPGSAFRPVRSDSDADAAAAAASREFKQPSPSSDSPTSHHGGSQSQQPQRRPRTLSSSSTTTGLRSRSRSGSRSGSRSRSESPSAAALQGASLSVYAAAAAASVAAGAGVPSPGVSPRSLGGGAAVAAAAAWHPPQGEFKRASPPQNNPRMARSSSAPSGSSSSSTGQQHSASPHQSHHGSPGLNGVSVAGVGSGAQAEAPSGQMIMSQRLQQQQQDQTSPPAARGHKPLLPSQNQLLFERTRSEGSNSPGPSPRGLHGRARGMGAGDIAGQGGFGQAGDEQHEEESFSQRGLLRGRGRPKARASRAAAVPRTFGEEFTAYVRAQAPLHLDAEPRGSSGLGYGLGYAASDAATVASSEQPDDSSDA